MALSAPRRDETVKLLGTSSAEIPLEGNGCITAKKQKNRGYFYSLGSEKEVFSSGFWTGKTILQRPVRYGDGVRDFEDWIYWASYEISLLTEDNQDHR
jgi:hypothetical protein